MSSSKKFILSKSADWDIWISFVEARATRSGIWESITPDLVLEPAVLKKPTPPQFVIPENDADLNLSAFTAYKARQEMYKINLALFEQEAKALGDMVAFIQETVATHNVPFIQNEKPHPWHYLRALKQRLAPTDHARSLEIEQRYHKLCKGPGSQNLETWLDEWVVTFTDAKKYEIFETTKTRPIRDFLIAIRSKESSFADAHLVTIESKTDPNELYKLIESFRQHIRLYQFFSPNKGSGESHSAFSTNTSSSSNATFRGQTAHSLSKPQKPCICGDTHWYSDCFYLLPEKRPAGWTSKATKQKKVDDAMKNDQIRAKIEKALQRHKDWANRSSGGASAEPNIASRETAAPREPQHVQGAFATQGSFATGPSYHLQGSWILDNGSDTHVCNSTMLSRFTKTHSSHPDDHLTAGTQSLHIECFGTIDITI